MWMLQRFFSILAIALILIMGILNSAESVVLKLGFWSFDQAPLPVVMAGFFLLGVLFHYLLSIKREWIMRGQIRKLKQESANVDRELQSLRRLSLEEGFGEQEDEKTEAGREDI